MTTILPFLNERTAFEPEVTHAMSIAFDEACRGLNLSEDDSRARETVALRIVELARRGECDPVRLRNRVLREAGAG